ncbi:DNA (cytosine-5-)-methyltransferase [uncultured Desulfuromusa sp.]|uniref:DNA cytosine methyltransferase n=1 Tax=uncultured Desulfuromusa sp. TaxID=219183 RepID=UPI002AA810FC|nr:DNA (cytosine-5-)-methyltransferase [uncultured Desulfuromusa sp.]
MPKIKNVSSGGKKLRRNKLAGNGNAKFKFNSFFAGIGGFDLGFERAGIAPAFHCEINEFCNSVLRRHWPNLPSSEDIKTLSADQLPDADVWCGGFPCQDVSVARGWLGRDGLKGKNTGLFYPFLKLVKEKLPQVVLLENVTGLLNSHKGHDFRTIISSFTDLGYGVAWRVMNARYFGAPQSRPRVFICAWKGRVDLALHALYEKDCVSVGNAREGFVTPTTCQFSGVTVPLVGYCLAATSGRHTGTDWSRTYVSYFDKVRRLTPTECEGLQGFPTGWSLPEKEYPVCDDDIDTLRYHSIGNAVCVPVVEWIAARIVSGFSGGFERFHIGASLNLKAQENINGMFMDFKNALLGQFRDLHFIDQEKPSTICWASGGAAFAEWYLSGKVSPAPTDPIESQLIDIIEKREVDGKYFLSPNAATGILRRVDKQGRTLFGPLDAALRRLAVKNDDSESCSLDCSSKVANA